MTRRGRGGKLKKITKEERAKRDDKKSEARERRAHARWADKKVMPGAG